MKKKSMIIGMVLAAGVVMSGCAANQQYVTESSLSTRNDVFSEASKPEIETKQAIVDIVFPVKSNHSRLLETYNKHTNPPYRVYLKIDGQTTILDSEPVLEDKSPIDSRIPESGKGWKYKFSKRIALAPGKHKLTVALPVDEVAVERDIDLHAGANTLAVTPIYKERSIRPYKGQSFTAGVKTLEVAVN